MIQKTLALGIDIHGHKGLSKIKDYLKKQILLIYFHFNWTIFIVQKSIAF